VLGTQVTTNVDGIALPQDWASLLWISLLPLLGRGSM
jgi:hypothetical protein